MSGLPKIDVPRYEHTLYATGKKIKYRPFTMKEQKILLLAKESGKVEDVVAAMKQIIELCTDNTVDANDIATFDAEMLFLKIRSKSAGEVSTITYKLKGTETQVKVNINLEEVQLQTDPEHDKKIMITDTIGLMMKYPTLDMIAFQGVGEDQMIRQCIDYVFDADQMYYFKDFSDADVEEWLESFDTTVMKNIKAFFDTMPKLRHEQMVNLPGGETEVLTFEGLNDFFD